MADQSPATGVVNATPEGGPVNEGTPATEPGAGQVRLTPEGGRATRYGFAPSHLAGTHEGAHHRAGWP